MCGKVRWLPVCVYFYSLLKHQTVQMNILLVSAEPSSALLMHRPSRQRQVKRKNKCVLAELLLSLMSFSLFLPETICRSFLRSVSHLASSTQAFDNVPTTSLCLSDTSGTSCLGFPPVKKKKKKVADEMCARVSWCWRVWMWCLSVQSMEMKTTNFLSVSQQSWELVVWDNCCYQ